MSRSAPPVSLTIEDRKLLTEWAYSRSTPIRVVQRAHMVLLAADGHPDTAIAERLNTSRVTAHLWRSRFLELGVKGLEKDAPRPGRKKRISAKRVQAHVEKTLQTTPPNATPWSVRTMAEATGLSRMTVQRIWKAHQLKPHLIRTFKLSRDKRFNEKLEDVVGLYVNPADRAIVLSVDEKSQIQARDRTTAALTNTTT